MPARSGPSSVAEFNEMNPVSPGNKRQWMRCRQKGCKRVYSYDYLPYSLSNPITWTPCGHSIGHRDLNTDVITEAEADAYFRRLARVPTPAPAAVPTFKRA